MTLFCVACAPTDRDRVEAAGRAVGEARAEALLPELPDDCRKTTRIGAVAGDRLDVALLRADNALDQQNRRTLRCADWYDDLQNAWRE
ncbi:hypothetical protein FHS89_001767 [Rubricella aquisinus]|uniref:Uncharacterized protein n=1 Tax=Rubricella aquisinus TaxID=2028108 RepID=A0A840X4Y1_9RHOB|nr:hypothetical protein [Rubricella aquisinus]MBB5515747.1 hypothetical protein [Rubricella aquisinus]